jgi:hypothetical protein
MGSAAVLRERGDDRVVGALVRVGDGVEDGADVGGVAEARVVREGVGALSRNVSSAKGNFSARACATRAAGRPGAERRRSASGVEARRWETKWWWWRAMPIGGAS